MATGLLGACIIVDPPTELPRLPPMRPTIVHGSVAPPASRMLSQMPSGFVVPVEVLDPASTFEWRVFVDYDPLTPSNAVLADRSGPSPANPSALVRTISFENPLPPENPDFQGCHIIEFLVAYSFLGNSSHTPDSRGGDSVVWYFNPSGAFGGCPVYDAGVYADARAKDGPDAGVEPKDAGAGPIDGTAQ